MPMQADDDGGETESYVVLLEQKTKNVDTKRGEEKNAVKDTENSRSIQRSSSLSFF